MYKHYMRWKLKKSTVLILIAVIYLMSMLNVVSCPHTGQGELWKWCGCTDESPIEGAKVFVDGLGTVYTDSQGVAKFLNVPVGTYYVDVDWDDDGIWDTIGEEAVVTDDTVTELFNSYDCSPPEVCGVKRH